MHWFFIALIGPILWSIISHTDKYLLSKFAVGKGVGSLILFSTLFSLVILPVLIFIEPNFFSISQRHIITLIGSGVISAFSLLLYFYALEEEEVSFIVPLDQLIPVFGYFFGVVILNEILEFDKILASVVVIIGALILSFEFEEESGYRFKVKPTILMACSCILLALNDVIFKSAAIFNDSFTTSIIWSLMGVAIFGITTLVLVKKFREDFIHNIKFNSKKYFSLNIFNEILQTIATLAFSYAILLAPVALVLLVDSYRSIFAFIIGIILTKYFPYIGTEKITTRHLIHKSLAIILIVIGSLFVYN